MVRPSSSGNEGAATRLCTHTDTVTQRRGGAPHLPRWRARASSGVRALPAAARAGCPARCSTLPPRERPPQRPAAPRASRCGRTHSSAVQGRDCKQSTLRNCVTKGGSGAGAPPTVASDHPSRPCDAPLRSSSPGGQERLALSVAGGGRRRRRHRHTPSQGWMPSSPRSADAVRGSRPVARASSSKAAALRVTATHREAARQKVAQILVEGGQVGFGARRE